MWYIIALVILAAGMIAGLAGCSGGFGCSNRKVTNHSLADGISDSIKRNLTRSEIIQKLTDLAQKPPPGKLSEGAMCYKVAAPPNRAEYICPVCGERTLYTDDLARVVNRDIPECRSLAESIKGVELTLDESRFCKKCSPDLKEEPSLCIITKFSGEEKNKEVCGIGPEDLKLMNEFMTGKSAHRNDYDYETPLKDHLDRIAYLLGIDLKGVPDITK